MEKNINKYLNEVKLTGGFQHLKIKSDASQYKPMRINREDLSNFEKLYEENGTILSKYYEI